MASAVQQIRYLSKLKIVIYTHNRRCENWAYMSGMLACELIEFLAMFRTATGPFSMKGARKPVFHSHSERYREMHRWRHISSCMELSLIFRAERFSWLPVAWYDPKRDSRESTKNCQIRYSSDYFAGHRLPMHPNSTQFYASGIGWHIETAK